MALDRITELFIMEAEEHLDTLEKGLVDLPTTMEDPENINEMFRAAHSVKGGAKMLGFESIGETAHRLEDCFKIIREYPETKVDQTVETHFLKGVDTLKDLLEKLKGPYGLRDEETKPLVQAIMPIFAQLEKYLNDLVNGKIVPGKNAGSKPVAATSGKGSSESNFASQVITELRKMLELFKQQDTANTRKELSNLCDNLSKLGAGIAPWENLTKMAKSAVNNLEHSYPILARAVITELKQAGDLIQENKGNSIEPSSNLQYLATKKTQTIPAASGNGKQPSSLPEEPKAAVQVLQQKYNKKQLTVIVKMLTKHIKSA